jgi:phytoene dehydrogenase-like protein
MGLYVLYFGTRRVYRDVAHHTIWMGPRYRELLEDIFHRRVLADDFSLYLHRPTATDPSFAPEGCDSFYVLCPVPNQQAGIDWAREEPRLRARIVAALDATILPGLKGTITADFALTPDDLASSAPASRLHRSSGSPPGFASIIGRRESGTFTSSVPALIPARECPVCCVRQK